MSSKLKQHKQLGSQFNYAYAIFALVRKERLR